MRNKFNQIPAPKTKPYMLAGTVNPQVANKIAAMLQQGLALHNAGELDQARVIYEGVLKLNAKHFDALQLLATIAAQTRQWDLSLTLLDEALKINKTHPATYNNRGCVLYELRRFEEALKNYDRATTLKAMSRTQLQV